MRNKNRSHYTAAPVPVGDRVPKPPVTRPKRPAGHAYIVPQNRSKL